MRPPSNGITADVIRDCMKPYGFNPDLLEDTVELQCVAESLLMPDQDVLPIEARRRIVPIVVIPGRQDMGALYPFLQYEGAVCDHRSRYFRSRCHEPSQPSPGGAACNLSMRLINAIDGPSPGIASSAAAKPRRASSQR